MGSEVLEWLQVALSLALSASLPLSLHPSLPPSLSHSRSLFISLDGVGGAGVAQV